MRKCTSKESTLTYNYLFFGGEDYIHTTFHELTKLPNFHFQKGGLPSGNRLLKGLFRMHWFGRLNKMVCLPGKWIWFNKMCTHDFHNDNPTCFIFYSGNYIALEPALHDYIKRKNPKNRIVIYYGDLIAKRNYPNFDKIRRCADLIISYDPSDAEKYRLPLYEITKIYSRILELTEPTQFDYDVYFIGYAKNRLSTIMEAYAVLTEAGLRCRFDLVRVPANQQKELEGVSYIKAISYKESLNRMCKAKCVLEILQKNATGSTLRYSEAIAYHRLLLSNSPTLEATENFIPQTMSSFRSPAEIDLDFIRRPIDYCAFQNATIDYSPIHFLEFIEENL